MLKIYKMNIDEMTIRAIVDNDVIYYTAKDVAKLFGFPVIQSSMIAGLCLSKDLIHHIEGSNVNYINEDSVRRLYQVAEINGNLNNSNKNNVDWFLKYGFGAMKSMIENEITERMYSSDVVIPDNINVKRYNHFPATKIEEPPREQEPIVFDSKRQLTVARCSENCIENVRMITYKNEWWFLAEDIIECVGLDNDVSIVKSLNEFNTLIVPLKHLKGFLKFGESSEPDKKHLFVNTYGVREICSYANNIVACLCFSEVVKVSGVKCELLSVDPSKPNNGVKSVNESITLKSDECIENVDFPNEERSNNTNIVEPNVDSEIKIFENEEFGSVRTIEIDGKPYFCGNDVAGALGYVEKAKAIRTHCKGVSKMDIPTNGGVQTMVFIPEGDIYRLIIRSKLPSAEKFERWIFDEVLPSIRKHGAYATGTTIDNIINNPDFGIRLLHELKAERDEKKKLEIEVAEKDTIIELKDATITEMTPAYNFGKTISESSHLIGLGEFAKILAEKNNIHIGEKRLFAFLRDEGVLLSGKRTTSERNYPRQNYINDGYFEVIENGWVDREGKFHPTHRPMITGKGQKFISELVGLKYNGWCNDSTPGFCH